MPLTTKQSRFVDAYHSEPNGKKAATSAGYSAASAEKAGSRLLRHRGVAAELARRRAGPAAPPAVPLTPMDYLLSVMNDPTNTIAQRIRAAMAVIPYTHAKPAAGGKKDAAADAAKAAATGKFAMRPPPLALIRKPCLKADQ